MDKKNQFSNKIKSDALKIVVTIFSVCLIFIFVFSGCKNPNANIMTDESSIETTVKSSQKTESTDAESTVTTTRKSESTDAETTKNIETTSLKETMINNASSIGATTSINDQSGRIIVDPDREMWNLVVVNMSREMPSGYEPKLTQILNTGKYLDYRVTPHYEQMYLAAKKDGIILTPYSAYRNYNRQKTNYENLTNEYMSRYGISKSEAAKKAATVILPPGTSEHNLGIAVDICNTYDSFANSKEYAWLMKNAYKYGFILRYTAQKQSITGIVPEPWHWRYVGVEYAEKIKDSGLCLEEYLDRENIDY